MRTRIPLISLAGLLLLGAFSSAAQAAVPGWARTERRTKVYASACALAAETAIKSVTGVAPVRTSFDSFTYEVRGFTGNVGIFAYCTTSPAPACPNRPAADLVILTFSSQSPADAAAKRDAVDTAFGNPVLFDCN